MNKAVSHFSLGPSGRARRVAVLALLLLSVLGLRAQSRLRDFSADQVHIVGKRTTTGKIYASEKAIRVETALAGRPSITIMRFDRKVMWILLPAQKMYMEMGDIGAGISELAFDAGGAKTQRELLGNEQVGSYHCDKYRVQIIYEGKMYTNIEWDARELNGFAVRKQGTNGEWSTEYQNIHPGPQDPSLFELPSGYQKMNVNTPAAR